MRRWTSLAALVAALLSLPLSAQITGTVIGRDGGAIVGVEVRAFAIESSTQAAARLRSDAPERVPLATGRSDDDGQFALEVEGHDVADLVLFKEGYAPHGVSVRSEGEIGAYVLRPAEMLEGTVSYMSEPVSGAAVCWRNRTVEYLVRTDENGAYHVPDPTAWKPALEVHHPSMPIHRWNPPPLLAQYRKPQLEVSVSGRTLSGVVVGKDDAPVPDADIIIDGSPHGATNADGKFEIEATPAWKELEARSGDQSGRVKRGAKDLRVKLAPAIRILGRVLDERGRGISEARVSLTDAAGRSPWGQSLTLATGTDGSFASDPIAPATYRVVVVRPGYSTGMSEVQGSSGENVSKEIILSLAASLEGTVRDEDRDPIAAGWVGVEDRTAWAFAQRGAATGPDGRYVLLDVPGSIKTKVWVNRRGYPAGSSETFETKPGVRLSGIDVTMITGHEVTGRVVDSEGTPVSGALVGATDQRYGIEMMFVELLGMEMMEHPTSDDEGAFTIRVARGTWTFVIKAPGFVQKVTEAETIDGARSLGEIVMEPGGELSGRVVRVSGAPVEDAFVAFVDRDLRAARTTTDNEGRFSFQDLPRRMAEMRVGKSDGSAAAKQVDIPSTNLVIELPDVVVFRGRVIDAESKEPIRDFALGVTQSQLGGARKTTFHSEDGSFEIEGVPTEGLALAASAAGYAESKKLVTFVEGSDPEPVEITLAKGVHVYGTVRDESGRPMQGVTVNYDKSVEMARGSFRMREASVTTDANGSFSFDSVSPGSALFGFSKQGYLSTDRSIDTTGPEHSIDVELTGGVALRGVVVDSSGAPVAGAEVRGATSGAVRSHASMKTGPDGKFVLEPLAAGRANVVVQAFGFADSITRDVEIATTPELRVVLEEGAIVEGRVIGIEPDQMQSVLLEIDEGPEFERRVKSSGEFRIEGVKAGKTIIAAYAREAGGYRTARPIEVDLVAGQVTRVEIEFVEGNTIHGVVTLGEKTLAGAAIAFRPKDVRSAGYVSTRTDENGRYEAVGLVDGAYGVTVSEPATRRWFETSYEARGSGEFDIQFEEGKVEGRVVESETGDPIAGATVTVEVGSAYSVSIMSASSVTDTDGRFVVLSAAKGDVTVTAAKKGYGTVVRQISSDGTLSGIEIEMARSAGTRLRVVDARDNRPLAPIVAVEDAMGRAMATQRFRSETDGVVTLDLAPGQYRLQVGANGYASRPMSVTVPSEELRVALTPGGKLVLRAPLDRTYRVTIRNSDGFVVRRYPGSSEQTILVEGSTTIAAIAPGEYNVEATPTGGGSATVHRVQIEEGGTAELSLE